MKNFVQTGDIVTMTAPYAVSSGDPLVVGALFGVCEAIAVSGAAVSLVTEGVFVLPKKLTTVFAAGDPVYFDPANKWLDAKASGFVGPVGSALAGAGTGVLTVRVKITEAPVVAVP